MSTIQQYFNIFTKLKNKKTQQMGFADLKLMIKNYNYFYINLMVQ